MRAWGCLLLLLSAGAMSVDKYNVVWTSLLPESNTTYVNTMPVGNGDVVANVWADKETGSIGLLLAKSDAWSEASELIKVGIVTVTFQPNPFGKSAHFKQEMNLPDASVRFEVGGTALHPAVRATVYVHADTNILLVNVSFPGDPLKVFVTLTPARPEAAVVTPVFDCASYLVSADVVLQDVSAVFTDPVVVWYHRNTNGSYFTNVLSMVNMPPAAFDTPNPIVNRTIGGAIYGAGLSRINATTLGSTTSQSSYTISIAHLTEQTSSVSAYIADLHALATAPTPTFDDHVAWWTAFWSRSWVEISSNFTVTRQYVLQRLIQATQARSPYPIKFNGMLYTANRPPNTDYRDWGGHNWWQNARLPYYNMLAAGDADMLEASLLAAWNKSFQLALMRVQHYWNFTGAYWDEYTNIFGITHPDSYGCGRAGQTNPPIWYSTDRWNHYNLQGSVDLSLFILDHYAYTQNATVLATYLPIAVAVVEFYAQRYTAQDSDGKTAFYPIQSIETWQCPNWPPNASDCVKNDMPTLAGLWAVLRRLAALPSQFTTPKQVASWEAFMARLPAIPAANGELVPCDACPSSPSNVENAELYAVHPYRNVTIANGSPLMALALKAFANKRFPQDVGWNQNAMDAAMLGLTAQAKAYVEARASMPPAEGYRFPAFMPHLQDYEPSADHLAVFNNAVQYMLIQPVDDAAGSMVLLPSWPCDWDVSFKLLGPVNTVVAGELKSGKLTFSVDPPARASAVKALPCTPV